jgi:hypothetical protein
VRYFFFIFISFSLSSKTSLGKQRIVSGRQNVGSEVKRREIEMITAGKRRRALVRLSLIEA